MMTLGFLFLSIVVGLAGAAVICLGTAPALQFASHRVAKRPLPYRTAYVTILIATAICVPLSVVLTTVLDLMGTGEAGAIIAGLLMVPLVLIVHIGVYERRLTLERKEAIRMALVVAGVLTAVLIALMVALFLIGSLYKTLT